MIGVDIISVKRIEGVIKRWGKTFIDRVFTQKEQEYCESKRNRYQCYAARFAAKESFYKAYNHPYGWRAVEIVSEERPFFHILDDTLKKECERYEIHLSISHTEDTCIAFVLLTLK
ncbi:holo-ACP synthase [candidate division WOR-3 bacterium]|nr:holo-ACP synthase [candidate division WOR-3 bacterium]MCK4528587.1 holo-ACP synthase [candidate division WOR-3 bacterium]